MFVLFLMCVVTLVASFPQNEKPYFHLELAEEYFEDYVARFDKHYASEEEKQLRFEIFKMNLIIINERNFNSSSIHGFTQFTDWSHEEFKVLNGFKPFPGRTSGCNQKTDADYSTRTAPDSFDWRDQNAVSPVKNQGNCGSCWAFSSVANVESQNAIKTGQIGSFSEQQLVDCVQGTDCKNGGDMQNAMTTIISEGGLESEDDYPYAEVVQTCAFDQSKIRVQLSGCNHYQFSSEDSLKEALYKDGPLSIAINADGLGQYKDHYVDRSLCPEGAQPDHAVLLVGYGTADDGTPVWYIKNSWGSRWGNAGFFVMQRNANMCGILGYTAVSSIIA